LKIAVLAAALNGSIVLSALQAIEQARDHVPVSRLPGLP